MLTGDRITLRTVRAADLDALYEAHVDIRNRGHWYPLGVQSESAFRREHAESGFWKKDGGTLLIVNEDGEVAGHIEFFVPVPYWDAFELAYQLYDDRFAGRGYVTEAVQLLVDYLTATKKQHRLQLVIAPDNLASRRIATKCGFVEEGSARGAFFNQGVNQDVLARPWHVEDDQA